MEEEEKKKNASVKNWKKDGRKFADNGSLIVLIFLTQYRGGNKGSATRELGEGFFFSFGYFY